MSRFATPSTSHLSSVDFNHVYEPAEDSFLMMDALEMDAEFLIERRPVLCMEVGSGSGVLITFLASILGNQAYYMATDINPEAALCTRRTAQANGCNVCCVVTDLVSSLCPSLLGKVDVLIFNPPYVVTPAEEVGSHGIEASWAGGAKGREVTDRLLPLVSSLLSPHGCFYLVAINENNPDEIKSFLESNGGLHCKTVLKRKAGREKLSILRFTHSSLPP